MEMRTCRLAGDNLARPDKPGLFVAGIVTIVLDNLLGKFIV